MADEIDRAAELVERFHAEALDPHRRRRRREAGAEDAGPRDCLDCEEPIPPERRKAAPWSRRCADCQSLIERGGRS
ncbi:TraR/DksA C4-type zinc finger protein [Inquilinus limosus]|uniref:TraR/DksA C4-type zinc finger protein n=1 Tax=Inquilinus limosus TaxID=171674 RepID=UPI003F144C28